MGYSNGFMGILSRREALCGCSLKSELQQRLISKIDCANGVLYHLRLEPSRRAARKARLFREKVEELELQLWRQAGKPEGGPVQFRLIAQQQWKQALNGKEGD